MEDQRPLSSLESAFRRLVKHHLAELLEKKRIIGNKEILLDG
jgi:hypothetical protein